MIMDLTARGYRYIKRAGRAYKKGECMNIRKINIKELNAAHYNPRVDLQKGDPEYQKLENSIKNLDT